uniref:S-adenosyl-L-methionine-dependent methyltransferase n=2 Tax=Chenopodium quinoa TaxID=63459 RepID=A0A803MV60_CHEQI
MVATNILSLYHLSSTTSFLRPKPPSPTTTAVPQHLLRQLQTIRATITHLTRLHPDKTSASASTNPTKTPPSDLLIFSNLAPIASSCHDFPDLLHQYMNYTPFSTCPKDNNLAESLILRGCHPLPRRRCFSRTPSNPRLSNPDSNVIWGSYPSATCKSFKCLNPKLGFDPNLDSTQFLSYKTDLDLTIPQLIDIAKRANSVIRLGVDVGGGTGTFAAKMKERNVTILTTTMNLGAPYSEFNAIRGVVPLHAPLQQRLPVFDGVIDLVRCGHAVNRWIPTTAMEFLLFDVDRVLRGGGYLWVDHFFCKGGDLEKVYKPLINKLGYKIVKWATGSKMDSSGVKNGEVYLTALLQKPKLR